jgi:tetratricopeptide (TPR) repeat protein
VPALVVALGLIALGLRSLAKQEQPHDFDAALTQVEELLAAGELVEAHIRLTEVIEPSIATAPEAQRARFHAAVGDWLTRSLPVGAAPLIENSRRIKEQYGKASELGHVMDPARLEAWGRACLDVGEVREARERLAALDEQARGEGDEAGAAAEARRRLLRWIVALQLARPEASVDELQHELQRYRESPHLAAEDEAWAIEQQAELRLRAGEPEQAIHHLLLDMRRMEAATGAGGAAIAGRGELFAVLGRAYLDLGDERQARFNLQRAIDWLEAPAEARGQAMVALAGIELSAGEIDEAFERFDAVVRDFVDTPHHAAGLLGRAEAYARLGDHERSLADYHEVEQQLARHDPGMTITADALGAALTDRHDAALATGNLDLALRYITAARRLRADGAAPPGVLLRVASTSRQFAENLLAAARAAPAQGEIDPAIADAAREHFGRAAEAYRLHATALDGAATEDHAWADSLWLAADSADRAGWSDEAIAWWKEFLVREPDDDSRRAEAMFRLGVAHEARAEAGFADAIGFFERLIAEHPRSPFAARSHVPLARCYRGAGRGAEAVQQLQAVLAGERYLEPDAADYREAQLELGQVLFENGAHVRAIETLESALERYPGDRRETETRFRLAESHRLRAGELRHLSEDESTSFAERDEMNALAREHAERAFELFNQIAEDRETSRHPANALREEMRRLACLGRADCAREQGSLEQAIELYDDVARRYADHHCSMIALVQIVNCHVALGRSEAARAAHERALARLRQLPADALAAPDALMDRAAWEAWLESTPPGAMRVRAEEP